MKNLDIKQSELADILNLLPHRYPFLLVDRVQSYNDEEQSIVAIKNVTFNEPHFQGHFPSMPIMPGVLTVEALCQTCVLLGGRILRKEGKIGPQQGINVLLVSLNNITFRTPIVPGDQIFLHAKLEKIKRNFYFFHCSAKVDDRIAVSVDVSCTYSIH